MKRVYLWLISMLSGVLLALSWPAHGFTPLVFIALFPLFWVEDYVLERQQEYDRHQAAKKALRVSPKLRSCLKFLAILKRLDFQGPGSGFCLPVGGCSGSWSSDAR